MALRPKTADEMTPIALALRPTSAPHQDSQDQPTFNSEEYWKDQDKIALFKAFLAYLQPSNSLSRKFVSICTSLVVDMEAERSMRRFEKVEDMLRAWGEGFEEVHGAVDEVMERRREEAERMLEEEEKELRERGI